MRVTMNSSNAFSSKQYAHEWNDEITYDSIYNRVKAQKAYNIQRIEDPADLDSIQSYLKDKKVQIGWEISSYKAKSRSAFDFSKVWGVILASHNYVIFFHFISNFFLSKIF